MALHIDREKDATAKDGTETSTAAEERFSAEARLEYAESLPAARAQATASNVPGVRAEPNWDPHRLTGLIADRNLYTTKDEGTVVEAGSPKAAYLLAAKGGNIPPEVVARYGLTLNGDRVEVKKGEDGKPVVAPPATRVNEGQLDDGTPLVKAPTTGVLRPEPAPESPMLAIEEELKAKNPDPSDAPEPGTPASSPERVRTATADKPTKKGRAKKSAKS